jgi:hypothetical protein
MFRFSGYLFINLFVLIAVAACGSLSPPESCGDRGGTADEGLFYGNFISMAMFDPATGGPGGINSEGEIQFAPADELEIIFGSKTDVSVQACLKERKGGGKILFNGTWSFSPGENSFALVSYSEGSYVVRVIVDETLIQNLPFWIG